MFIGEKRNYLDDRRVRARTTEAASGLLDRRWTAPAQRQDSGLGDSYPPLDIVHNPLAFALPFHILFKERVRGVGRALVMPVDDLDVIEFVVLGRGPVEREGALAIDAAVARRRASTPVTTDN